MPKLQFLARCAAFASFFFMVPLAKADFTGLSYEVVQVHGPDAGALAGMTTYRVYANFNDATDIAQALYAESPFGMDISSSAGFYQDDLGGFTPVSINPLLYGTFQNLPYDSWVTIGQEDSEVPTAASQVGGPGWNSAIIDFEDGGNFFVNDGVGGSVFVTPDQIQSAVDANGQILLAQLTTAGTWNFTCNLQWRDAQLNVYNETGLTVGYEPTDFTGLSFELVGENTLVGENETIAEGFDTYRVYANFDDPDAQVVAVYGLQDTALTITTTGSFYQDALGGALATSVNALLFDSFEFLEYDSWVTIGSEDVSGSVDFIGADFLGFEAGGDLIIDNAVGGTWYILPDLEPDAFPDDQGRVLLGQFTTDGIVDILLNIQYRSSAGENKQVTGQTLTFPVVTPGCTDQGACNYNPLADFDDGSCDFLTCAGCVDVDACNYNPQAVIEDNSLCEFPVGYPNNTVDCSGNCLNDSDGDGVCDEDEVPGCTNSTADNYNPLATDDDGSCVISGCTDSEAENYNADATNDDGTCQFLVTGSQGCTYGDATNYDAAATLDDGSCEFDCSGGGDCAYDTDGNQLIGSADLLVFLALYGQPCGE